MPHVDHIEDGVRYPSVTEIIGCVPKPWLDRWRQKWGKRAEQKTRAATNCGTAFHAGAEGLVLNRFVTESGRVYAMLTNFVRWAERSGFTPKETELHVVSKIYKYAGTFDATGYQAGDKKLRLYDWKTSSSIYPEMALQLSAYAQAYFEQTGIRITKGVIVHVSKDKPRHKLAVQEYTLGKRLFKKFLKRLEYYNETRLK